MSETKLFAKRSLSDQLIERRGTIYQTVDSIPQETFLISDDEELIAYVKDRFLITPITLHLDQQTMDQAETHVDVSNDPDRYWSEKRAGPRTVPGTRVDICIPYSGDQWLFQWETNPMSFENPYGSVTKSDITLIITQPHNVPRERIKNIYEARIKGLRECIGWSTTQVEGHNRGLSTHIRRAIQDRRKRLEHHADLASLLDIPVAKKEGAPNVRPVQVSVRKPPPLPSPPKTGLQPEPGISDDTYEQILRFIRHQGRTFETTPKTYAKHDEEELRDIILAQLNGHFEGKAGGELFRTRGKTDICIQGENRAAFVGECKVWKGPAGLTDAIDQLLGYLTWRDSKAAIILFNLKNKDFSKIRDSIPTVLSDHPLFIRPMPCDELGEWRVQMRSEEDEGRRVTVHVLAFNLYLNTD